MESILAIAGGASARRKSRRGARPRPRSWRRCCRRGRRLRSEHIETEMRTASGIVDERGHFIAGVVLITAGYSAEGKYSHYLIVQAPVGIGGVSLKPGEYAFGWTRENGEESAERPLQRGCDGRAGGNSGCAPDRRAQRGWRACTSGRRAKRRSSRSGGLGFPTSWARNRRKRRAAKSPQFGVTISTFWSILRSILPRILAPMFEPLRSATLFGLLAGGIPAFISAQVTHSSCPYPGATNSNDLEDQPRRLPRWRRTPALHSRRNSTSSTGRSPRADL